MKGINLHKAGMEGLDAGTIDKIIEENSKGSKFYENEMRHGAILKRQVEEKLAKLRSLTHSEIDVGEKEADKLLRNYSAERRFDKCIVHIDMDAFYAAVEMRDNPSLRLKPLAVGSQSMLSTSNYLARRFGVRAAMPGFLGKKLCPQLTIVPPDFVKYTEVSRAVRAVLTEYCDDGLAGLVVMSLDEVYLNITQHLRERAKWPPERRTHWPRLAPKTPMLVCRCSKNNTKSNLGDLVVTLSPSKSPTKLSAVDEVRKGRSAPPRIVSLQIGKDEELATCLLCGMLIRPGCRVFGTSAGEAVREMRFRVFCATRLTCSAGIAPNSLIAKIASDWNKPNGQLLVEPTAEAVEAFISPLPIRKVPGIGYVTECRLKAFGVERIADIRERRGILFHLVSRTALAYYMRISLGHSEDDWVHSTASAVSENAGSCCASQKSMGVERTFRDCADPKILQAKCGQLCASLVDDMKEAHVQGKTVTMKFKLDSFEVRSRSQSLADYTCSAAIISQCASEILKDEMKAELMNNSKPLCLRLMGVRISNLVPSAMCQYFRQETLEAAFNKGFGGVETMVHDCSIPAASSDRNHRDVTPRRSPPLANENEPSAAPAQKRVLTTCPACSKQLQLKDLEDMNEHLDTCLSRQTIWDAVQETFPSTKSVTSKSPSTRSKRVSHPTRSTSIVGPLDKYFKTG